MLDGAERGQVLPSTEGNLQQKLPGSTEAAGWEGDVLIQGQLKSGGWMGQGSYRDRGLHLRKKRIF